MHRDDLRVSPGKQFDRPVLARCPRIDSFAAGEQKRFLTILIDLKLDKLASIFQNWASPNGSGTGEGRFSRTFFPLFQTCSSQD